MLERMRAVWLTRFGDPSVLVGGEAADPVPGPGQVLVDVAIANITFIETMFRKTGFGPFQGELPMIPGNGVGGVVSALGEGVDPALLGTRVVTSTGGSGGYATRAAVEAASLVPVPDGLDLDAAVALLADGRTALLLCQAATIKPGDRVLVEAAAGGVGTLLVQLAARAGATVVAALGATPPDPTAPTAASPTDTPAGATRGITQPDLASPTGTPAGAARGATQPDLASPTGAAVVEAFGAGPTDGGPGPGSLGEAKVAAVRALGVDVVVDYTRPGWEASVGPVDVVFDGVGGEVARAAFGLLQPGGRMVSFGLSSGAWSDVTEAEAAARQVAVIRGASGSPEELRARSAEALQLAARGELRPVIGQRFPLERAADAHAAIESRSTVGKTLLVVD